MELRFFFKLDQIFQKNFAIRVIIILHELFNIYD